MCRIPFVAVAVFLLAAACVAESGGGPSTQPTRWGDAHSGMRVAISLAQPVVLGKRLELTGQLQNQSAGDVKLDCAFDWVLAVAGPEAVFYTERVDLAPQVERGVLASGQTATVVHSVDRPGDSARQKSCWALSQITGNPWTFEPDQPREKRTRSSTNGRTGLPTREANWFGLFSFGGTSKNRVAASALLP